MRGAILVWVLAVALPCCGKPSVAPSTDVRPVAPEVESARAHHESDAPVAEVPAAEVPALPIELAAADWEAHQLALSRVVADARLDAGPDPFAFIDSGDAPPWRLVPIVPMAATQRLLGALARADAEVVRVAMYGASGTAADTHPAYVRGYLQRRFGDGGPGFIPLGKAKRWSRHTEATITASKGWTAVHAVQDGDGSVLALGPAGLAFDGKRRATHVAIRLRRDRGAPLEHIELYALAQPGGGRVRVMVDGGAPTVHATSATATGLLRVPLTSTAHRPEVRVELVGDGPVRLFGVVFERDRGVVVDTLGVDGARARNWRRWDESVWRAGIAARPIALATIAYGTNEAVDTDAPPERFAEDFSRVLDRLREAAPGASCVVLGPGDFPESVAGVWRPRPQIEAIASAERSLAAARGCGFWDELTFMGGPGSMVRWVATTPAAARPDHLHFTPLGAAIKGHFVARALVAGYDRAPAAAGP